MERDWARLGAALKAARTTKGLSQTDVGELVGVKRGAMRNIEQGALTKVTATVRAYARAVGWDDASINAVLAGGDPTPAAPPASERDIGAAQTTATAAPEELPLRIRDALAHGPLLDTAVINLPGGAEGPAGQMVIVVKGAGDNPEQLRRALLAWEATEARLRHAGSDSKTFLDE
ncbi:helix-turn-helix domain-containing protein [Streptomyces celluloflavus]|uniref:helix-turn-helix domain-containing protein n=1 Tax=Streptomyces celluloflavus TaxID=58344 RepID=UPI0036604B74